MILTANDFNPKIAKNVGDSAYRAIHVRRAPTLFLKTSLLYTIEIAKSHSFAFLVLYSY